MSKHLAKLNFTFRKEKKLNRFWGIFRIEVSLLQINLLLLQMSDTTALRRVGIKELGEITLGGISLVVLWLRLHLPVQGLQVQFLVGELSGEGDGTPLQYSCLENSMDGGAWWAAVHGVAKSRTQLSNFAFPCSQ